MDGTMHISNNIAISILTTWQRGAMVLSRRKSKSKRREAARQICSSFHVS
jgi:hypothetical protein